MPEYSGESGKKADAGRIIERILDEMEKVGVRWDDGPPKQLSWDDPDDRALVRRAFEDPEKHESILPGFGERGLANNARDDCGNPHPFLCDSCGSEVEFGRTCAQSVCARCGVAWARDISINKTAKLRRIRREKHKHTQACEKQKFHHEIISAPPEWYYALGRSGMSLEDAQKLTKKVVKFILDEMRAQGLVVRHSYRGTREDGSLKPDSDDKDLWKQRLNSGRKWYGDVRDQLGWMPHYHCVVVADWQKGDEDDFTKRIEDATGWVIHRITGENNVSIPDDGSMAKVVTYAMSHADIMVRRDSHNRSAVWEVGSFQGDPIRSTGRFSAWDSDMEWADSRVREIAVDVLGLRSGTTDCGAKLPGVEDPDQLAKEILEDLYREHEEDAPEVSTDTVLEHVAADNIDVEVSSTEGGGVDVSASTSGAGTIDLDGTAGSIPGSRAATVADGGGSSTTPIMKSGASSGDYSLDVGLEEPDCDCDDDHDVDDVDEGHDRDGSAEECDGTLIPLEEARQRGLLEDQDWRRQAEFVDEALEADRKHPDDIEPWRTSSPEKAIGAG